MNCAFIKRNKMLKIKDFSCFKTFRCCIYHANKCLNANSCWHFNNYEHDKVYAVKVVGDPCQKITILLLKSKSVRVIVPESCF